MTDSPCPVGQYYIGPVFVDHWVRKPIRYRLTDRYDKKHSDEHFACHQRSSWTAYPCTVRSKAMRWHDICSTCHALKPFLDGTAPVGLAQLVKCELIN